jgi:hypothetical protein
MCVNKKHILHQSIAHLNSSVLLSLSHLFSLSKHLCCKSDGGMGSKIQTNCNIPSKACSAVRGVQRNGIEFRAIIFLHKNHKIYLTFYLLFYFSPFSATQNFFLICVSVIIQEVTRIDVLWVSIFKSTEKAGMLDARCSYWGLPVFFKKKYFCRLQGRLSFSRRRKPSYVQQANQQRDQKNPTWITSRRQRFCNLKRRLLLSWR